MSDSSASAAARAQPGRVVRKVLVTAAIGGLTYLISDLTQQSQIDSLILTAFLGGVALVVQFLTDFEDRLAKVELGHRTQTVQMRSLAEEKFADVSEATELFGRVEASTLRTDVLDLVRHANRIKSDHPDLIRQLARSQVQRASEFLRDLSGGNAVVYNDGEDRDWLLALTRSVRATIDATSRASRTRDGQFIDEGLWFTELGQRYFELQRTAITGGVEIRRLFILQDAALLNDKELLTVLSLQHDAGVSLRTISSDQMTGTIHLPDLILFDRVLSYESSSSGPSPTPLFTQTMLVIEPAHVREQVGRFHYWWSRATEWPPPAS
jgi:hypothetical protein